MTTQGRSLGRWSGPHRVQSKLRTWALTKGREARISVPQLALRGKMRDFNPQLTNGGTQHMIPSGNMESGGTEIAFDPQIMDSNNKWHNQHHTPHQWNSDPQINLSSETQMKRQQRTRRHSLRRKEVHLPVARIFSIKRVLIISQFALCIKLFWHLSF